MTNRRTRQFVAVLAFSTIVAWAQPAPAASSGQKSTQKLSASAIQVEPVETEDISVPAEFRFAIYERVIERLKESGTFQKVIRSGDHQAEGIPDLVSLHVKVEKFKEGNQTARELTTVIGSTQIDVGATVTARDGHALLDRKIKGKVRFRGENLTATNDLAKRITKILQENF
jgi:hypothetical protein